MNNIYQYKYNSNGRQFVSTANPLILGLFCQKHKLEVPEAISVWKFKAPLKTIK